MYKQLTPFLALFSILALALVSVEGSDDHSHAKALKDFVPDHPHLHELVDKTHAGDVEAKHKYEREALSVRYNQTKSNLPNTTDEVHIVLHFLDDYTAHVTGGQTDHQFMQLEPFIDMLDKEDDLKHKLKELGALIEKAECDFTCLGDRITDFMNESIMRMTSHLEL